MYNRDTQHFILLGMIILHLVFILGNFVVYLLTGVLSFVGPSSIGIFSSDNNLLLIRGWTMVILSILIGFLFISLSLSKNLHKHQSEVYYSKGNTYFAIFMLLLSIRWWTRAMNGDFGQSHDSDDWQQMVFLVSMAAISLSDVLLVMVIYTSTPRLPRSSSV